MLPESECKGRDFLRNGKRLEDFFEKNMRFSLIQWDGGQIMGVLCRQRNVALRGNDTLRCGGMMFSLRCAQKGKIGKIGKNKKNRKKKLEKLEILEKLEKLEKLEN